MLCDRISDTAISYLAVIFTKIAFCLILHPVCRVSGPAANAHAGNHVAFMLQELFSDGPTLVFFTHEVGPGNSNVIKECFAERRSATDQLNRFCCYAFRGHVKKQKADAFMLGRLGVSSNQAENPIGVVGIGGPDLRAINNVIVPIDYGTGLQAGEVLT